MRTGIAEAMLWFPLLTMAVVQGAPRNYPGDPSKVLKRISFVAPSVSGQENSWETSMGEGVKVGFLQSGRFSAFVNPTCRGKSEPLRHPARLRQKSELALPRIWVGHLPR